MWSSFANLHRRKKQKIDQILQRLISNWFFETEHSYLLKRSSQETINIHFMSKIASKFNNPRRMFANQKSVVSMDFAA